MSETREPVHADNDGKVWGMLDVGGAYPYWIPAVRMGLAEAEEWVAVDPENRRIRP